MPIPPEGIGVGDSLTQEEIEDAYNTGFGYRISGINPRRDDHDRRYILLFANEDGPYGDSVTQGRFEYIGEGLSGDQSADSPGNSALIDARTSDIPIHFFYKRAKEADWEYQGLIDVVDYEFKKRDGRDVLVFTVEHQQSTDEQEHANIYQLDESPEVGETYIARVDRISNSGNGIIELKNNYINVGPVTKNSKKEKIRVRINDGQLQYNERNEVDVENSDETLLGDLYGSSNKPTRYSAYHPFSTRDTGTLLTEKKAEFCDECGSIMKVDVMKADESQWICNSCGYEKWRQNQRSSVEQNSISSVEETEREDSQKEAKSDERSASERDGKGLSAETTETDVDELRKNAEKSAVKNVPEEASTTTTEKPQYNRSLEVKKYVKARADGTCEGCGEPAPFTSKKGEPYLHAHHIHELSNGGSDTPDTVVALCPNCHYRVHHGKGGDEYNKKLLETVQEMENSDQ